MKKADYILAMNTAIEASKKDSKATKKSLIEAIEVLMLDYSKTASNKVEEHPNYEEDGVTMVWCLKHQAYETSDKFAVVAKSKTGFHNKCLVADYQWRKFLKDIKEVSNNLTKMIVAEKYDDVAKLNKEKMALELAKDAPYTYPNEEELKMLLPVKKDDN